jgi:endoglucanase
MRVWPGAAAAMALWSLSCAEGGGTPESLYGQQPAAGNQTSAERPRPEFNVTPVGPPLLGLHAVGGQIQTEDGEVVRLRGVNRSGSEYQCVQNRGIFEGPSNVASVQAIANWNANAVRVPLNEACWLGINRASRVYSGENYRGAIMDYVATLQAFNIAPILELHWSAPGEFAADRLQPLPNVDHSIDFWRSVAETFRGDDSIIFEAYNEPFPDRNRDTDLAWQCWRDGCMENLSRPPVLQADGTMQPPPMPYAAAGMQSLVDAIRESGATNLILLGGVQYSNALSQWLTYMPSDPLNNLGAAWHIYDNNACRTEGCWSGAPAQLAQSVPVVVTELGQRDCADQFIRPLLTWLDGQQLGYLAWSWNAYGPCVPATMTAEGSPWSLITDYVTGNPNSAYAQGFHDHLLGVLVDR